MITYIETRLKAHFTNEESVQIKAFLDKGFCENGQIAILNVFLHAKEHKKSVTEVLNECEKERERNWECQDPEIRGDPDAPGGAGMQNRALLQNIYSALKIPPPLNTEIPLKAITVTTKKSVYQLGKANKLGERTIYRDNDPLDFNKCIIIFLSIGRKMELKCLGDLPPSGWNTTIVHSIE